MKGEGTSAACGTTVLKELPSALLSGSRCGTCLAAWALCEAMSSSHSSSLRGLAHSQTSDISTTTGRLCRARQGTCRHAYILYTLSNNWACTHGCFHIFLVLSPPSKRTQHKKEAELVYARWAMQANEPRWPGRTCCNAHYLHNQAAYPAFCDVDGQLQILEGLHLEPDILQGHARAPSCREAMLNSNQHDVLLHRGKAVLDYSTYRSRG